MLAPEHILRAALAAAALAPLAAGQTTRLTFGDANGTYSGHDLVHGYGDRVSGATTGSYRYEGAAPFTPNVLVSFGGQEGAALREPLTWGAGYSDLVDVLYVDLLGVPQLAGELQVTFAADPGFEVGVLGFDVGGFGDAATLPYVRLTEADGTVLQELPAVDVPGAAEPARRVALGAFGRVVTLRVSLAGVAHPDEVGLDGLEFTQRAAGTGEVGAPYCGPAATNSTFGPASIRGWGSPLTAANDLRLAATGLPFGCVGYFMASRSAGFVAHPAGSSGNLCLGGAIGRFIGPGQVRLAGTTGVFTLDVDLARLPSPNGPVPAQGGETWRFQAWYRDSEFGVATSNFTDALAVTWQ